MKSIFTYLSYKKYLKDYFGSSTIKGIQTKVANAAGCQPAYLSQCLNGKPHLTEDQCFQISVFLGLNPDESEYLLLMLRYEKAGYKTYRDFLKRSLMDLTNKNLSVKKTVRKAKKMSLADQTIYYSKWAYSAVHMLCGIPKFQNESAIAQRLQLEVHEVKKIIDELINIGLIKKKDSKIVPTERAIHIGSESPLIQLHHKNLRLMSIQESDKLKNNSLLYSSTITISEETFAQIKEILITSLKEVRDRIEVSEEEDIFCLNLDLFRVK